MNAPFLYIAIALSSGIIVGRYNININYLFIFLLISVFFSIIMYKKSLNATFPILISIFLFGVIIGTNAIYSKNNYETMEGKLVTIRGTVSELKKMQNLSKYIVNPDKGLKILVSQYGGIPPENGDLVNVRGIVYIPPEKRNPGGFNYRLFLRKNNIGALMSIKGTSFEIVEKNKNSVIDRILQNTRNKIRAGYAASMPKNDAEFVSSMILGDYSIDDATMNSFRITGIAHVLSVSGLHVGVIALFIIFILGFFKINRYSTPIVILILIFYTLLTGSVPPVMRSTIMASMALIGTSIGRNNVPENSISVAAVFILLINPLMIYDVGFQLSFIATLSIIYLYNPLKVLIKIPNKKLKDMIALTMAAQIGTIPIILFYFHNLSLISLLANILIVPITGAVVILGFISAVISIVIPFLSFPINYINIPIVEIILYLTKFLSCLPYASLNTLVMPFYAIILYYIMIIVFLSKLNKKLKYQITAIIIFIFIAGIVYNVTVHKGLEVTFLDVGQGDSAFVETPHGKKILIDGGGRPNANGTAFDVGHNIVMPFLYYKNTATLDTIFISHTDIDHIGGVLSILNEINVKKIFIGEQKVTDNNYKELIEIAKSKQIPVVFLTQGDVVTIDGIDFIVLSPGKDFIEENPINNNALTFKMIYRNADFLFTGDIEKEAENKLKNLDIKADVLKVPHHGSNTSSTKDFIEKVNPEITIISVGKNNYGHPNVNVVKYLASISKLYRTDRDGAVIINTDGNVIKVKRFIED
ncbi:DNA internalization-related competence protein ComEC/Rec2 [Aceticella autotrophica]|uniref:DNA internalization-related competence protein ComEC/Rec2 n=1 Tax=Aceticella autotrophica TaxID=2755338 RepID=A0A975AUN1_9THEO|nr:DNA internalization-related competence protein ComEC/Rec2 [Aceticella autotrophica]QSZ26758.1 DNA internalization-related competence protein ComEC/Rec2 [Aceticella autotrophica]